MDTNELIDQLKKEAGIETDAEIASYLGCTVFNISRVRKSEAELPSHSKFILYDSLHYFKATNLALSLLPQKARNKAIELQKKNAKRLAEKRSK